MVFFRRLVSPILRVSPQTAVVPSRRALNSFTGDPRAFVDAVNLERIAMVYFYTPWCEPCQRVTAELATWCAPIRVIAVDADANPKVSALHDVRSVPTLVAYRGGCIVGRLEGSAQEEVRAFMQQLTGEETEKGEE